MPGWRSAARCCTSRARRSARSSPRIRCASSSGCATRSTAMQRARSTSCSRRADGLGDGEHRDILETYRMFAEDRGWLARIAEAIAQRPHRRGGGAEGAERHPRAHDAGRAIPICASGWPISTISPTGCSGISPGAGARPAPSCRTKSSWSPAPWARPSCWITTASGSRAWCSKKARRPRMSRSSRAPSTSRSSAGSRTR